MKLSLKLTLATFLIMGFSSMSYGTSNSSILLAQEEAPVDGDFDDMGGDDMGLESEAPAAHQAPAATDESIGSEIGENPVPAVQKPAPEKDPAMKEKFRKAANKGKMMKKAHIQKTKKAKKKVASKGKHKGKKKAVKKAKKKQS